MLRSVALGLCAVVSLGAAVACGQRATESSSGIAAALSDDPNSATIDPRRPLPAQEWVRCWFARNGARVDVMCKRTDAATYPYQVQDLYVSARSASTHAYLGDSGRRGPILDRDTPQLRASITRDDFPIDLEVRAKVFSAHTGEPVDVLVTPSELITQKRVLGPTATEAAPLAFAQPFDLWPVRVVMVGSQGYDVQSGAFDVGLGPFLTTGANAADHVSAKLASKVRFASHTFLLPVPKGGHVDATATMHRNGGGTGASAPLALTGPGLFIAEDTGVRVATDAEAQDLLADLPPPTTPPAPPASTPTPAADAAADAQAPADPPLTDPSDGGAD